MKKILIFIPSLYQSGGAERVAHSLANDLNDLGHEIHVITISENNFENTNCISTSFGFKDSGIYKIFSSLKTVFYLYRYQKKHNIDVVISHMERANFISIFASFFAKTKTIGFVHNYKYLHLLKNSIFIKIFYPFANKIVCVSKGIENELIKKYNLQNTQVIYNNFDFSNIEEEAEKNLEALDERLFDTNKFTFITIGRLVEQKGHDELIKAFVKADIANSQLIIIGEGEKRSELESLVFNLMATNIHLVGTRHNVFPLLKKSQCFVLSSRWEGFGLVLVEALASSLFVISRDCKFGPKEILNNRKETVLFKEFSDLPEILENAVRSLEPKKVVHDLSMFDKRNAMEIWSKLLSNI